MSEKMTTANSAEQGKVDIDFAECAVPKWSRRRFVTMFMIMLGFTFFSASMWVGQEMGSRTGLLGIYQSPPSGWCDPWYLHRSAWLCRCRDRLKP